LGAPAKSALLHSLHAFCSPLLPEGIGSRLLLIVELAIAVGIKPLEHFVTKFLHASLPVSAAAKSAASTGSARTAESTARTATGAAAECTGSCARAACPSRLSALGPALLALFLPRAQFRHLVFIEFAVAIGIKTLPQFLFDFATKASLSSTWSTEALAATEPGAATEASAPEPATTATPWSAAWAARTAAIHIGWLTGCWWWHRRCGIALSGIGRSVVICALRLHRDRKKRKQQTRHQHQALSTH
jgi:hypothetical protein